RAAIPRAAAEDFAESFDGGTVSWKTHCDEAWVQIDKHQRHAQKVVQGKASEYVQVLCRRPGSVLTLEHAIPAARILDDLKLTVWVSSNRTGATPSLRVVFPHARDPATGEQLTALIPGAG